jgi:DNA-binding NarL/FixJ family response regulator
VGLLYGVSTGREPQLVAQRRVSVRKTKEILRLKFEAGLSNHKIARACGVSASTV